MADERPNILLIMTDQQRYDDLSCHGGRPMTPCLDRLAAESADFSYFFTQSPVCVPSRCNLFTGRYPHSHRVRQNHARLADHEVHLFKVLQKAGYSLGYVGKNHLLDEKEFTHFDFVDLEEHRNRHGERPEFQALIARQNRRLDTHGAWASAIFHDLPAEDSHPYLSGQSAVRFLRERPTDRPFCLVVSFEDPHAPHLALKRFEQCYPLESITLPECPPDALEGKAPRWAIKKYMERVQDADEIDKRRYLAARWAMITWVDENIGVILDMLDASGIRDNTIVIFTSDHGDFAWEYGMVKKDLVFVDSLLHVPLLLRYPGHIAVHQVAHTMVEQVDVLPTLLDLCGLQIPYGCQGSSFIPLLAGEQSKHKDAVFAEIERPEARLEFSTVSDYVQAWEKGRNDPTERRFKGLSINVPGDFAKTIRTERYRYVWYAQGYEELYDLEVDPHEWHNRVNDRDYTALKTELRDKLLTWLALSEDPVDPEAAERNRRTFGNWLN
ncbi:MAG: sulfatase family protein [Anaerolineae bacterium]